MVDGAAATERQPADSIASANAHVHIWSTDVATARERFSYWREAVSTAVFGIGIQAAPERFSARITGRTCGALRFAMSESTGYDIVRGRREIDSGATDHCSIYLQLSGQTISEVNGETVVFNPNDIGIYDGRQTFRAAHSGRRAIAVLPRAMIDQRAPWLRQSVSLKLTSDSPYADLVRGHVVKLSSPDSELTENAVKVLSENLCNLIALATADDLGPRLATDLQIEALLTFCRQNLHDFELSPQLVADRFGISVRTLHSRFRQIGQTFGRWVLENRLEACGAALRDRNQRDLKISEIAYRWGFNDLSYFNKAFRARFDRKPSEWRNES
jgi:AraC family transcriptional regulator, positive regulator of tynA and feaB